MINGIVVQNNPLKYIDPRGLNRNRVGSFSDGGNDYTYDYTPNPNVSLTPGNREVPSSASRIGPLLNSNRELAGLEDAPEWVDKGQNVSTSSGLANKIIKEAVGFIPVVGSGIESYNKFKDGKYVQGSIYAGLAVAEAVPVLAALSKGAKYAPKIVSSVAKFLKGIKKTDTKVIGRLDDTEIALDWPGHDILNVADDVYTRQLQRNWVDDGIRNKQPFYKASPTEGNLVDDFGNPTQFSNELRQVKDSDLYEEVGDYLLFRD